MKKLMFMFAAVSMAVCTQAAQVAWSINVSGKGADWSGANAYAIAFNGSDYAAVIKLLTVDGSDNMATALNSYALALTTSSGTSIANKETAISNTRGAAKASGTSTGTTGDTMFFVVFTEGSMDANSAIAWTAATDVSAYAYEAGSPQPGTFAITSFANTGTIAGVPEPTSGLLMLVGLAGLALRRKRA